LPLREQAASRETAPSAENGLEFYTGASTGRVDVDHYARNWCELDLLILGTQEDIARKRNIGASADRKAV